MKTQVSNVPVGGRFVEDGQVYIVIRKVSNNPFMPSAVEARFADCDNPKRVFFGFESVEMIGE